MCYILRYATTDTHARAESQGSLWQAKKQVGHVHVYVDTCAAWGNGNFHSHTRHPYEFSSAKKHDRARFAQPERRQDSEGDPEQNKSTDDGKPKPTNVNNAESS